VILPDDLMVGTPGALWQMVDAYDEVGGNIVCAAEVPRDKTASYGIVTPGARAGNRTEVAGLVEKPLPEEAPSTLGVIGRYILQPEVMRLLDAQEPGAGGEIQLTDALAKLVGIQPFHAVTVDAVRYDCGTKLGFVSANLALGMADPEIGGALRETISSLRA
jgi:UTP--glucose-1-phosphate uridylyltransferase